MNSAIARSLALVGLGVCAACGEDKATPTAPALAKRAPVLHWFIPDGMRADPELFDVFRWAQEGKLPNLKRLMEGGTYGYAIPTFPSHTPTNFATLVTGSYPRVHGIADGPMHTQGHPLETPSVGGFSSAARKVPAVWSVLAARGHDVAVVCVPGSTPPELDPSGIVVRGRWSGWGADFHALIFESASDERRARLGRGKRLFFRGDELTRFIAPSADTGRAFPVESFAPPLDLALDVFGASLLATLVDTTDDARTGFDRVVFAVDAAQATAQLAQGEWSDWVPVTLTWREQAVASHVRFHVIKLAGDGTFRLRVLVDNVNALNVVPHDLAQRLAADLQPSVDFVDNYPAQLVHYAEDKRTFLDELAMSFAWHERAVGDIYAGYHPDVFIHTIYSPNQMLTSRWWLGYVDPASARYDDVSADEREALWGEVMDMYRSLDAILGAALEHAGEDTLVVLSSDHGATPLDRSVRLNNLFHSKGWLAYTIDPKTREPAIDWARTRVVYLKMYNVYVHPDGLAGDYKRGSGPAYEALRAQVWSTLEELADADGRRPVASLCLADDAGATLRLPADRVGDIVVANRAGYGWNEEVTADGAVFSVPETTGYKQAVHAATTPALWAPFVIAGPGIKRNYRLTSPLEMADQLPTILRALDVPVPEHVEGRVLDVFE